MKLAKYGFNKVTNLKLHYERDKKADEIIKDTSFSKINPTKTHLNYNLCEGDMIELLEAKKKTAYIRSEKTDVAFCDLCITYPKDCSVSPEIFFKALYDILTHDRNFKNCIGAFVHFDETSPHMHYIFMPIEKCKEFTKSKDIKVFDEKKQREVKRRVKTTYTEKFNAKGIIDKELLNNLHPYMQKKINERGIQGTIITPERVKFNAWKKEQIEYYNDLIKKDPDNKDKYVNEFWEKYQQMNPKEYKKGDRAKDSRLEQFNNMIKEYEEQKKAEFERSVQDIDKKFDAKGYYEQAKIQFEKDKQQIDANKEEALKNYNELAEKDYIAKTQEIDNAVTRKLYVINEDGTIATDENGAVCLMIMRYK